LFLNSLLSSEPPKSTVRERRLHLQFDYRIPVNL
jgi:hypothetical protein